MCLHLAVYSVREFIMTCFFNARTHFTGNLQRAIPDMRMLAAVSHSSRQHCACVRACGRAGVRAGARVCLCMCTCPRVWWYCAVVCAIVDFQSKLCGFDPRRVRFHMSSSPSLSLGGYQQPNMYVWILSPLHNITSATRSRLSD